MSTKIRLICKWVPNLPQIICKWSSYANESQLICKRVLTHLQMRSEFNCKWVQLSHELICKWDVTHLHMSTVLIHLQMSLDSVNEPPTSLFLLYFPPQCSHFENYFSPHKKAQRTSHPTPTKHHHYGCAVCCYSGMTVANQPALPKPKGASPEGAGRGRYSRVLFNNAYRS
jgi:hypothetical protein